MTQFKSSRRTDEREREKVLIARHRANDSLAFPEIYELLGKRVIRFLHRKTGNHQLAEDISQSVFIELHEALSKPENPVTGRLTSYCLQIAFHEVMNYFRKHYQASTLHFHTGYESGVEPEIKSSYELWEYSVQWIRGEIEKLPDRERDILRAYFWDDMSHRRIAEEFQLTARRIHQIIDEITERLRQQFDERDIPCSLDPCI